MGRAGLRNLLDILIVIGSGRSYQVTVETTGSVAAVEHCYEQSGGGQDGHKQAWGLEL